MKKEFRIFLIILIGWLALLDFAILRTVITKSISDYKAIIVKNLMSGAAVYYPADSQAIVNALIIPLIMFNALVIIFLSLSYYFWIKSKNRLNINKKISGKRGQAAMEFMMTYGWAVMALVISIAALAYFGVFTNFSPTGKSICALSPGFLCKEFVVGPGGVMMTIQNSLGVNINTVTVNITNSPQGPCNESMPPKNLQDGASDNFYVPCLKIGSIGQQFKGDIVIKYKKDNAVLNSVANGMMSAKVQNYTYNDTEAPIINLIEPINGYVYPSTIYNVKYQIIDNSNIKSCTYSIDNGYNMNIPYCLTELYGLVATRGLHTFKLTAIDANSNVNSVKINFSTNTSYDLTDTILPWLVPSPYDGIWDTESSQQYHYIRQGSIVNFSSGWFDDKGMDGCVFAMNYNNSWGWQNSTYTNAILQGGYYGTLGYCYYNDFNITAPIGTYISYKFYAYDINGNMNTSKVVQSLVIEPYGGGGGNIGCTNECLPFEHPN